MFKVSIYSVKYINKLLLEPTLFPVLSKSYIRVLSVYKQRLSQHVKSSWIWVNPLNIPKFILVNAVIGFFTLRILHLVCCVALTNSVAIHVMCHPPVECSALGSWPPLPGYSWLWPAGLWHRRTAGALLHEPSWTTSQLDPPVTHRHN